MSRQAGIREARANCIDGAGCSDVRWTAVICEYVGTNVALYRVRGR
jgi:hypothetical protein